MEISYMMSFFLVHLCRIFLLPPKAIIIALDRPLLSTLNERSIIEQKMSCRRVANAKGVQKIHRTASHKNENQN
jgi:hypothetical protein